MRALSTTSVILALCLYLLISAPVTASAELKISPPDFSVQIEDTVEVKFLVCDVYDLFGAGFDLAYDPNQLDYIKAEEGTFLNSNGPVNTIFMISVEENAGELIAGITRSNYSDGGASSAGDTNLMSIYFRVTAADSIPLTITKSSLIAPDGVTKYPHTVTNGYIKAYDPTWVTDGENTGTMSNRIDISSNYPNPFNSSTTIDCHVISKQKAEIYVVNLLGQRVETLFQGTLSSGKYSFTWDGKDWAGRITSSGVYFFVFQFENYRETRKVIYLK